MKLHFPITEIKKGVEELKTAKTKPKRFDWEVMETIESELGFMLVGDQGVYLMPITKDGKHNSNRKDDEGLLVTYAKECDPTKLEFDEWWENKRNSFGGDDGADFIGLNELEPIIAKAKRHLVINISASEFEVTHD
jgi:hypothetical protein